MMCMVYRAKAEQRPDLAARRKDITARTGDRAMDGRAVLELDRHDLVVQLLQKRAASQRGRAGESTTHLTSFMTSD